MNTRQIRNLAFASALAVGSGVAAQSTQPAAQQAQQKKEEPSLAEIARRAREQRTNKPVAQPVREFTNETIPPPRGPEASLGPATEAADTAGASAGTSSSPSADRKQLDSDLAAARAKLEQLKKDLDLQEREARLSKDMYYSKPDYSNDRTGAANLAAMDAAIAAKKTEIAEAETKLKELEDRDRALGPRPGPQTPEEVRASVAERIRPLREELARVNAEIAAIDQERMAMGSTTNPAGAFTGDRLTQLQTRRAELQRQLDGLEEESRRAGVPRIRD